MSCSNEQEAMDDEAVIAAAVDEIVGEMVDAEVGFTPETPKIFLHKLNI